MRFRSLRASTRFKRSVFRGRCRRNLLAGLVLFVLAIGYGIWAASRFASDDDGTHTFDRAIVQVAPSMIRQPAQLRGIHPRNITELYLVSVISDDRDALVGMTILALRGIIALTGCGLGLVLLTAGATEWEVRSELGQCAAAPCLPFAPFSTNTTGTQANDRNASNRNTST